MSKQLAEQKQVYSFLQSTLDQQRQQLDTNQVILNRMLQIEQNVDKKFVVMTEMVQEVRDSVTLMNAECDQLLSAVASKSISLTKDRYSEEDGSFNKVVGAHRRMIWKQLKNQYQVPKYNCIRRIDFEDAMEFVSNFKPEAYI